MTLAERAQALGAGGGEGHAPTATLARLKEDVRLFVSVDDIAALMAFEPARARSELRAKPSFGRLSIACSGRSAGVWTSRRRW